MNTKQQLVKASLKLLNHEYFKNDTILHNGKIYKLKRHELAVELSKINDTKRTINSDLDRGV